MQNIVSIEGNHHYIVSFDDMLVFSLLLLSAITRVSSSLCEALPPPETPAESSFPLPFLPPFFLPAFPSSPSPAAKRPPEIQLGDLGSTVNSCSRSGWSLAAKRFLLRYGLKRKQFVGIISVSYTHLTLPTKRIV